MESLLALLSEYSPYITALVLFLLILEQISYQKRKSFLPGPTLVIPFIGNAIPLIKNPTKFWEKQSALAQSTPLGISTNYFFGKFILYIYSTEFSHKVFANVRPDAFHLIVHPFGKKLFAESNLVYQFGQEHKDLRRRVAPNFTPKGLAIYSSIQQRIILKHLKSWLLLMKSDQEPIPLRFLCRDMNLETSQTVFVGPYLSDEARKTFNVGYDAFNEGAMKLPIDLPGFGFRKARLAVKELVEILAFCAGESEKKMKNGEEPTCLIDFWVEENIRENAEAEEKGVADIDKKFNFSREELGGHLFDFLFAAQDASTSSLLWAITLLDSHPHVLQKVRSEVEKYWNPLSDELITAEQLREMKYTEAVAKEVLRVRAPATLVPHNLAEDFALTENYVIPKGTVVFPSVFDSCLQGFPNADQFDPDRFMEERQEDKVYKKNFLTFGAGAHQCIGQRYAINHLKIFVAMFATLIDFKRAREDGCDDIAYVPTIIPKDECKVFLSLRCKRFPSIVSYKGKYIEDLNVINGC